MKEKTFERIFSEVREFIRTKDKRLKKSKFEIALAKQEFLATIMQFAEEWFDKRIKKKLFTLKREIFSNPSIQKITICQGSLALSF